VVFEGDEVGDGWIEKVAEVVNHGRAEFLVCTWWIHEMSAGVADKDPEWDVISELVGPYRKCLGKEEV
jgi:hypothetical protein